MSARLLAGSVEEPLTTNYPYLLCSGDQRRTGQILTEIRQSEYDMVALGSTYAAQSLRRYFAPGITDRIVEHAGRPVLVVRHR